MPAATSRLAPFLAACLLFSAGCGREEPISPSSKKPDLAGPTRGKDKETVVVVPARPEATPEAAIRSVVAGLKKNRPSALWEFLPASFQQDVNSLVHDFARRMDAELWNKSFQVAGRLVRLMQAKRELLVRSASQAGGEAPAAEQLAANWDAIVAVLDVLVHSDAADLEKLRVLDVGRFLEQTGGRLFEQLSRLSKLSEEDPFGARLNQLAVSEVTVVEATDDTATVRIAWADEVENGEPALVPFVRVEGKWIPQAMATQWPAAMEQARQAVATVSPSTLPEHRERVLARLEEVDQFVSRLENTDQPEEFDAVLQEGLTAVLAAWTGWRQQREPAPPPIASNAAPVKVVVLAELDAEGVERLAEQLLSLADDLNSDLVGPDVGDGVTVADVAPVADVAAFARRITFGKVVRVDLERRVVTLQAPGQE